MNKEDIKSIKINLISSLIWQIIVSLPLVISLATSITNKLLEFLDKFKINNTLS